MYACVSWASAVKTYTLVHVSQLFSLMKPSSMNQKKRWAKDWAFFWKMNGRFVVRARPYITPRSSVPREETQTHNTQPKFCFYDHNTTARQFPDKTNRTSKGNVLGSSTKSCRREDHQRLCNRNSAETPYTPIQHSQRCERT